MIVFDFEYYYKNQNLYFIVDNSNNSSGVNRNNEVYNSVLFFKIWRNCYLKLYILKSIYIINHRNFNPNTQLVGYCRNYEDINSANWMMSYNHIGLLFEKVYRNDRDLTFCLNSIEKIFCQINKNNIKNNNNSNSNSNNNSSRNNSSNSNSSSNNDSFNSSSQKNGILFNEKDIENFYINLIRYYREYLLNYSDHLLLLSIKYDNIIAFKLLCSLMTSQYPYSYSLIHSLTNRKSSSSSLSSSSSSSSLSSSSSSSSLLDPSSCSGSCNDIESILPNNNGITGGIEIHFTRNLFDTAFENSSIEILDYIKKSKSHIYYLWDHTRSFIECFKNGNDSSNSIQKRNKLCRYLINNQMENINLPEVVYLDDNNGSNVNKNGNNTLNSYFSFFTNYFFYKDGNNNENDQYSISDKISIPFLPFSRLIELDTDILIEFKSLKPTIFNYRCHDFNQFLCSQYKGSLSSIIFITSKKQQLFISNFILIYLYSNLLVTNNSNNNTNNNNPNNSNHHIINLIRNNLNNNNSTNNNKITQLLIQFLVEKIIMNNEFNDHLKISIITEYKLYLNKISNNSNSNINSGSDNCNIKEIKEILNNNPYCFSIIFQLSYEYGDSNLLKYCLTHFHIKVYLPLRQNVIPELFCQCSNDVSKQNQFIKTLVDHHKLIESMVPISWFFISLLKDEYLDQVIYFYELMEEKGINLLSKECLEEASYNDSELIITFFIKKFKNQMNLWKKIIKYLNTSEQQQISSSTSVISEELDSNVSVNNQEEIKAYENNIKTIISTVWNNSVTKIAAKRNNLSLLLLVHRELPNLINESTMEEAIENQNFEVVKFLIYNNYPSNTNCFLLACRKKDFRTLIFLMDNKSEGCDLFQLCEYNSNLIEYIRTYRKKDYESNRFGDLHQFESRIIREIGCSREICLLYAILSYRRQQEIDKQQQQSSNINSSNSGLNSIISSGSNENLNQNHISFFSSPRQQIIQSTIQQQNNSNNSNTILNSNYSYKVQSFIKPSKSTLERFRYINSLSRRDHIKIVLDELSEDMNESYLFHLQFHLRSIFESIVTNGNLSALKTFLNHQWIKSKFPKIFEQELQIIIEKTIQFGYMDMLKYFLEDLKLTLPNEAIKIVVVPNLIKNGSVSTLQYILKSFPNLKIKKFHVELAVKYRKQHMIRFIFQKYPKLFNNPKQYLIKINNSFNNSSNNSSSNNNNNINQLYNQFNIYNYFKQQHQNQFQLTLLQINNNNNNNSTITTTNNTTTTATTTTSTSATSNLILNIINNTSNHNHHNNHNNNEDDNNNIENITNNLQNIQFNNNNKITNNINNNNNHELTIITEDINQWFLNLYNNKF